MVLLTWKGVCKMGKKDGRLGEVGYNTNGERMTIIRYVNKNDIDIQFDDGTIVEHRYYGNFLKGNVKNPFFPSVYGVGYFGIGEFKSCNENGKITKSYNTWKNIHERCYNPKFHKKFQTYENCTVCKEWNNYQTFAKWDNENYYEVGNEQMALDKDILNKRNKVYSPNNCIYVPYSINSLFVKRDNERGELPIGVSKHRDKFRAILNKYNKQIHLGIYPTPEEAFQAYKQAKEQYIKEVAEEYKDKIPYRLYEAMMNYEVEIDD